MMNQVRLDMNEVPFLPPAFVIEAAQKGLSMLNRYADFGDLDRLRERVADYARVPRNRVILGPGSDLLLREFIHAFSLDRTIITPSPSFFPTIEAAKQSSSRWIGLRLDRLDFHLDPTLLMEVLQEPCLVVIDNPNNPTGRLILDRPLVEAILENNRTYLVIDEAYYEFSQVTFADLVVDYPNLAITRTLDKTFGLAGARIGYAIVGDDFQAALSSFFSVLPQPTLYAAMAALNDTEYAVNNVRWIREEREWLRAQLDSMQVRTFTSHANFLLVDSRVPDVIRRLSERSVKVCDLSDQMPSEFFRVSVGTRQENEFFLSRFAEIRIKGDQLA